MRLYRGCSRSGCHTSSAQLTVGCPSNVCGELSLTTQHSTLVHLVLPSPSLPSPHLPGGNVKCVLEVLEVLDNQLYTRSAAVSPITALMRRLRTIMANPQVGMTGGWGQCSWAGHCMPVVQ